MRRLLLILLTVGSASAIDWDYEYVVAPPAVHSALLTQGWDISPFPRWSPDSTRVLFDRNGNIPFRSGQLDTLRSYLDVEIVPSDSIAEWSEEQGWNVYPGGGL